MYRYYCFEGGNAWSSLEQGKKLWHFLLDRVAKFTSSCLEQGQSFVESVETTHANAVHLVVKWFFTKLHRNRRGRHRINRTPTVRIARRPLGQSAQLSRFECYSSHWCGGRREWCLVRKFKLFSENPSCWFIPRQKKSKFFGDAFPVMYGSELFPKTYWVDVIPSK